VKVAEHELAPFGIEPTPLWEDSTTHGFDREDPMRFTGHERDFAQLSRIVTTPYLDYMHARYYSPGVGRFLSVDPVINMKMAMVSPQTWNRYAYVVNNPMRFTDPTGQYVCRGNDQACNTIEVSMKMMRFAAAKMSLAEGRRDMQKVADAYGKREYGTPTTTIKYVWADPTMAGPNGMPVPVLGPGVLGQAGKKGNVFVSLTNIVGKAANNGAMAFTILAGTLTHEGDHELHRAVTEFTGTPSLLSLLYYETRAYSLERSFYLHSEFPGLAPDAVKGAWSSATRACSSTEGGCYP
jgi:RHS repeat-associated protein